MPETKLEPRTPRAEPAPQQPQLQPPAPAPFPGELPEGIAVYQPGPQAPWEM